MAISKSNRQLKFRATQDLIAILNYLETARNGITDAGIAAITNSGTVDKFVTYIESLTALPQKHIHFRKAAVNMIRRAEALLTFTDAMVDAARDAGSLNYSTLISAIISDSGVSGLSATAQPLSVWA